MTRLRTVIRQKIEIGLIKTPWFYPRGKQKKEKTIATGIG